MLSYSITRVFIYNNERNLMQQVKVYFENIYENWTVLSTDVFFFFILVDKRFSVAMIKQCAAVIRLRFPVSLEFNCNQEFIIIYFFNSFLYGWVH